MQRDFKPGQKLQTLGGLDLLVTLKNGDIYINDARILAKGRQGSNGVLHSIDCVNLPMVATPA